MARMAWEHLPCGTIANGKVPPMDCGFCSAILIQVMKGKQHGWRRVHGAAPSKPKKRRKGKSGGIKRAVRDKIFKRDCYRCRECGSEEELTIDHIIPKAAGGTNAQKNLQVLCSPCNNAKADMVPEKVKL